jgi:uncharacterized damage-inducible protein DinB
VTDGLLEAFRHNAWANRELLVACKGLTDEQLAASATGTYGSILSTLQHIVDAEASYRLRISGEAPDWAETVEEVTNLTELERYAREMEGFWEVLLAPGFDPDRVLRWYSPYRQAHVEAPASVLTAQTLNHGSEHRSQICTVLTTIGVEPPELDVWSYATATDRIHTEPGPPPP